MGGGLSDYNGMELFFLLCALIGGVLVLFKLVMQLVGGDTDGGVDGGALDGDLDLAGHHVDSDLGFRFLSMHGFSAFMLMFGLVGLAIYRQNHEGAVASLAGAVAAGLASVWLIGKLFLGASRLQSSGTLRNTDLVGSLGTVYLTIPAEGKGRVNISHHNRRREYDAISATAAAIKTDTPIRVTAVQGNLLTVAPIIQDKE